MSNLRSLVRRVILESMHRCQDGAMVEKESIECYNDVCARIEDATYTRDQHPRGTASRTHYNGILQDLRKKQRMLKKMHMTI